MPARAVPKVACADPPSVLFAYARARSARLPVPIAPPMRWPDCDTPVCGCQSLNGPQARSRPGYAHFAARAMRRAGAQNEDRRAWTTPPWSRSRGAIPSASTAWSTRRSTTPRPSCSRRVAALEAARPHQGVTYGRYGTPTTFALEEAVAQLEGGYRAIAVGSGKTAITSTLLALLRTRRPPAGRRHASTRRPAISAPARSPASASRPPSTTRARRRHRRADPARDPDGVHREPRARSPSRCRTSRPSPRPPTRAAAWW